MARRAPLRGAQASADRRGPCGCTTCSLIASACRLRAASGTGVDVGQDGGGLENPVPERQRDPEEASLARLALHRELAATLPDDVVADAEPQSRSHADGLGGEEPLRR